MTVRLRAELAVFGLYMLTHQYWNVGRVYKMRKEKTNIYACKRAATRHTN